MEVCTKHFCHRLMVGIGLLLGVSTNLSSVSEAKDLTQVLGQGLGVKSANTNLLNPGVAGAIAPGIASGVTQAVTQEFPQAAVSPAFTFRYNPTLTVYERATTVPGPLFTQS